jgi:hypothetical protein
VTIQDMLESGRNGTAEALARRNAAFVAADPVTS